MAVLSKQTASGAHWYTAEGRPLHTTTKADGIGMRPTTLRDARKLMLLPSVTGVIGVLDKPALATWKAKQAALAAEKYPRTKDESEKYWLSRVLQASKEETSKAANLGGQIHDALEQADKTGTYDPIMADYVKPTLDWTAKEGIIQTEREVTVVNTEYGYAGRVDAFFTDTDGCLGILDYKSRKTKPGLAIKPYDGQAMQLAAYAVAKYGIENLPRVRALNIYISTTEPGRMHVHPYTDLTNDWDAFVAALVLWRYTKKYDPRRAGA